jgi:hypothetical protein
MAVQSGSGRAALVSFCYSGHETVTVRVLSGFGRSFG